MTFAEYEKDPNHIITGFITYYYNQLSSDPSKLYQLYREDAVLKHTNPFEQSKDTAEDFNTLPNIEKYWKSLTVLSYSKIVILTVNTIKQSDESLVSTIVGEILLQKDYDNDDDEDKILPTRTFTQTFILCPDEKRDSYSIKSDILVYIPLIDYTDAEVQNISKGETNGSTISEINDKPESAVQQEVVEKAEPIKSESNGVKKVESDTKNEILNNKSNIVEISSSNKISHTKNSSTSKKASPSSTYTSKSTNNRSESHKSTESKRTISPSPSPVTNTTSATPSTAASISTSSNTPASTEPSSFQHETIESQMTAPSSAVSGNNSSSETTSAPKTPTTKVQSGAKLTPAPTPSKPISWANNLKNNTSAPSSSSTGKSVSSYTKTIVTQPSTASSTSFSTPNTDNKSYEISITCKNGSLQKDAIEAALTKEGVLFKSVQVLQYNAVAQFDSEEMLHKALDKKVIKDQHKNDLVIEKRRPYKKKSSKNSSNSYNHNHNNYNNNNNDRRNNN